MRQTKIVCTLGQKTCSMDEIKNMMEAGMDVARINMDYFESNQLEDLINNIKEASKQLSVPCPIFIDLKGMLIRTLSSNKPIEI